MSEPLTEAQEDAVLAGQRRVNIIWEITQAFLAVVIITGNVAIYVVSAAKGPQVMVPQGLQVLGGMVIGFYFNRTNHSNIGGPGHKPPNPPYTGR